MERLLTARKPVNPERALASGLKGARLLDKGTGKFLTGPQF
jgi:hypothetical protein